jgi:glycosyl transferase family 87
VSYLFAVNPGLQGDLRIYRAAAQAWAEGRDPYQPGALVGPAGNRQELPFVYPPVSLPLMRALLAFDHRTTYFAFFVLKMAAVAALVALWRRRLFPDDDLAGACLYLFCALAYAQTIKMDVRAGNISVFEQLPIWTAILAFLRRRPRAFAALVAAAALFKLTTAGLLLLLLLDRSRRSLAALAAGVAGLALVHGVSAALRPDLFAGFLRNAAALDDRGKTNPCTLALIRDGIERLAGGHVPGHLDMILYGLAVLLIGLTTLSVARRQGRAGSLECFLFAFALAAPRFKDYSYILLIPPSVYVVVNVLPGFVPQLLAALLVCTHLFAYQSWVAAVALFIALLAHPRPRARRPPGPAEARGPA